MAPRFREVFRFYLGHKPTEEQFQKEWAKLDASGDGRVDVAKWAAQETARNPTFSHYFHRFS